MTSLSSTNERGEYPSGYSDEGQSLYYPDKPTVIDYRLDESLQRVLVKGATETVKPLRFGSAQEVGVTGMYPSFELREYIRTKVSGTDIPAYIFDDHNHALFAWREALQEGRIDIGSVIAHFDEHPDGMIPTNIVQYAQLPTVEKTAEIASTYLNIEAFMEPAVRWGIASGVVWIDPGEKQVRFLQQKAIGRGGFFSQIKDDFMECYRIGSSSLEQFFPVSTDPRQIILDIDIDYFNKIKVGSKRELEELDLLRKMMRRVGVVSIATSPGYIDQIRAISLVRRLGLD